jgi:DNA (cytosine-5)-methyltransferase 1
VTELSLFTGAGGGLLGTKLLGWKAIGYVEKEPYCQKVIRQRIADGILDAAPIFGDIRKFISEGYAASYQGMVDVITGGFPCQDISCAGTGKGIEGERSGLWNEMSTVIRIVRPKYVFVENSPMLLIRGLGTVLRDLAEMGFNAKWGVLGSEHCGYPHKRARIWIMAYSNDIGLQKQSADTTSIGQLNEIPNALAFDRNETELFDGLVWPSEPEIWRVVDGVANWMDRIKATGNMQVPAVVASAWRLLSGI